MTLGGNYSKERLFIPVFDTEANAIMQVVADAVNGQDPTEDLKSAAVYDLSGRKVAADYAGFLRLRHTLQPGVFIVGNRKVMLR